MAQNVQIHCINKSDRYNPHERILRIGGINQNGTRWSMSQEKAIADTQSGTYKFYVAVSPQKSVWVIVATSPYGHLYLKTEADGDQPNNLLELPECPA